MRTIATGIRWGLILAVGLTSLASADEPTKTASQVTPDPNSITWGTEKGGVQCAVELVDPQSTIPADQPVWVRFRTRKVTADETRLFSRNLLTYQLIVTDAEGKPVPQTRYGTPRPFYPPYQSSGTRTQEWKEGREEVVRICLNRLYDMSRPGKYTISFSRKLGLADKSGATVESNTLAMEIIDTDVLVPEPTK